MKYFIYCNRSRNRSQKMKKANIIEIAKILGVSKSTVSRALSDHPDISEKTRKKVLDASAKMGYAPNYLAKSLATNKTYTIGLLLPHIRHTFLSEIFNGADEVFHRTGYSAIIANSQENDLRELANIRNLISRRVDGLLVSVSAATSDKSRFEYIKKQNIPMVLFERYVPVEKTSYVLVDYEEIYTLKIKHLLSLGCRNIVFVCDSNNGFYSKTRLTGLKKTLKKLNFQIPEENFIPALPTIEGGRQVLRSLMKNGKIPDAIDGSTSLHAIGAAEEAVRAGISIPDGLMLTGNIVTPFTEIVTPRITGVRFPIGEMGRKAAEILISEIESGPGLQIRKEYMKTELVIRESTRMN